MKKKLLPIGAQDFASFKENNYIYVDKTENIYRLVTEGRYYFLSRPRRFGKSLLVSTLKECDCLQTTLSMSKPVSSLWPGSMAIKITLRWSVASTARVR